MTTQIAGLVSGACSRLASFRSLSERSSRSLRGNSAADSLVWARGLISFFVALLLLGAVCVAAHAQSVVFTGTRTTVGSGLLDPAGVAVDGAGNIFIADFGNNRVVEVPAGGGAQTIVPTIGLNTPFGVAVDGAGNVFIADFNNNRVVKVPADGSAQTTVGSGLNSPTGVAVDAAGNVFIADRTNNRVVKVSAVGGAQTVVPAIGLDHPSGVAVDGAGNVFIADTFNNRVVEVPAGGGAQTIVVSGLNGPFGVAVDGAGNVFIADTFNNRVVEVPAGGGTQTTVISGLNGPTGVAVDGAGEVFIADEFNNRVVKVQRIAVNFGSANICPGAQTTPAPCSQTFTLNYDVTASTTFGTTSALTQGAPNLDFTLSSTTCTGTITAGNACTATVKFAPRAPGLRMGAVQLTDSLGAVLVTTLIYGQGQGPAIAFDPGAQTTVGSVLSVPSGVAVDGAGNVFIVDSGNNQVVKVPAGGGAQTLVASGLNFPNGVAVDGAGNVFIADTFNDRVVKVPAGGGAQTTVGSGLHDPTGVAVDGAGNVFIADFNNNRVVKVPAGGGVQTTVGSGLNGPGGVAVDGAGNVFIADFSNNRVVEVPAGGGAQTTLPVSVGTPPSGLNFPQGVAVDGVGNVFIADTNNNRVVKVPAGGGAQTTVGSGLMTPTGVAVDGAGNVFIADFNNNRVVEVQRSQPPTLSFAATPVGSTSSDSPQSVTAQNVGNQTLTVTGLSVGTNFLQVPGTGTPADCSSSSSLAPGETCNLSINFAPQSVGSIISAAIFTDNALNSTAPAMQSVTLQGTGQLSDLTITKTHTGTFAQSGTGSYTITVTNVGPGATLGTVTVVDTPATGMTVTAISGTGWTCTLATRTCTRADVLAAGASYPTITVTVTIAGNAPTSLTNSATVSGGGEVNTTNDTAADVTTIAPGLVITVVNGTATVSQGNTAGFSFNVTGAAGLALGTISFSCPGLPEGAACLFNPPSVTTLPAQVGLSITTSNLHFSHNRIPGPLGGLSYLFGVMMLPFLGLAPMGAIKDRRSRKRVLWLLLIAFALLLLAGCGFTPQSGPRQIVAPGVYNITVTATSSTGGVQAQAVVTLNVQ